MDPSMIAKLPPGMPQMAVDELGNPFILLKDQQKMERTTGVNACLNNISACLKLITSIRTSFGPKGADKIIVSPDGQVTVTNDGATIMDQIQVEHQATKLLVELSKSQDDQIGDGTTGVVILAGALLEEAEKLIRKGVHPLKVIAGFETASTLAVASLDDVCESIDIHQDANEQLVKAAKTSLGSKLIHERKEQFARICVDAILTVANKETKDVNFDLIKIDGKAGGKLEDSQLVKGVVVDKEFSHCQMPKKYENCKVAILTCPFEPPKPKTKHKIDINSVKDYERLLEVEQEMFVEQVKHIKNCGADFVICQWGFDYEANHLLFKEGLPSIRWIGGHEIEHIAVATGARIVPRFEELTPEKLGFAKKIEEVSFGTEGEIMTFIEQGDDTSRTCTVILRGGNSISIAEAERSVHDALCAVRNLFVDPRIVPGGAASETNASRYINSHAANIDGVEQYSVLGFADALLSIGTTLAENSGLDGIKSISHLQSTQTKEGGKFGLNCFTGQIVDMLKEGVYESYASKASQFHLATQVVKMILRVDDIISSTEPQ